MQVPESRSTMREKVRALAKFQMHKLTGQRAQHLHHGTLAAHGDDLPPLHDELVPTDPLAETESHIPPGLPGYRVAPGHSGWDPVESVLEVAFLLGKCLRNLIVGQLKTHHPFGWALMALVGFCLIVPFADLTWRIATLRAGEGEMYFNIVFVPLAMLGVAFWINLILNLQTPHHA